MLDARARAALPSDLRLHAHDDSGGHDVETHLCSYAADEIERLREEVRSLTLMRDGLVETLRAVNPYNRPDPRKSVSGTPTSILGN